MPNDEGMLFSTADPFHNTVSTTAINAGKGADGSPASSRSRLHVQNCSMTVASTFGPHAHIGRLSAGLSRRDVSTQVCGGACGWRGERRPGGLVAHAPH